VSASHLIVVVIVFTIYVFNRERGKPKDDSAERLVRDRAKYLRKLRRAPLLTDSRKFLAFRPMMVRASVSERTSGKRMRRGGALTLFLRTEPSRDQACAHKGIAAPRGLG
jgi:hypothetical protein